MNAFQEFKYLHGQSGPLYIGNVWDVNSALLFEKMGYKSIGTSSAAIATSLGYEDGEEMSFDELLNIVATIKSKTLLPLTVDLEAGYSRDAKEILENIVQLCKLGVVGINLEDSVIEKGNRRIVDATEFSETLKFLKNSLLEKRINIFFNARTDFFVMGLDNPLKETVARATLYEQSGVDGIFVPCVTDENDIREIVDSTSLPVNVMTMPNLPMFSTLQELGVKRVSMGPFFYNCMNEWFCHMGNSINEHQSFSPMFSKQ